MVDALGGADDEDAEMRIDAGDPVARHPVRRRRSRRPFCTPRGLLDPYLARGPRTLQRWSVHSEAPMMRMRRCASTPATRSHDIPGAADAPGDGFNCPSGISSPRRGVPRGQKNLGERARSPSRSHRNPDLTRTPSPSRDPLLSRPPPLETPSRMYIGPTVLPPCSPPENRTRELLQQAGPVFSEHGRTFGTNVHLGGPSQCPLLLSTLGHVCSQGMSTTTGDDATDVTTGEWMLPLH